MVDYVKTVLSKVSFDGHLFEKELLKALKDLMPTEIIELKNWCYQNFKENSLIPILNKVF
ncbi:MAG: hypothetical protein U0V72_07410 [Cytophagales bacterium]